MRDNMTAIALVLDRSGSMGAIREDTIGAVNTFIKDQRKVDGDAIFWLTLFNTELEHRHEGESIDDVPLLDESSYVPRGATALHDAVATTIDLVGDHLAAMDEADRPTKVVFVVQTDGLENSSREYKLADVKAKIEEQSETYDWQFVFLGADQDAWASGGAMGVSQNATLSFDQSQMRAAYSLTSDSVAAFRSGTKADVSYDQTDIRNGDES